MATPSRRAVLSGAGALAALSGCTPPNAAKIPVIFNTDVGGDIDDAWALLMLLRTPQLDLKLVSTDGGASIFRARAAAKILNFAGRGEIPIGVGLDPTNAPQPQSGWLGDYDLASYGGPVHQDGADAIIETIMTAPTPITVISVSPATSLAAALAREPRIADKARFVGMYGSIRRGMPADPGPIAEWNVKVDPAALQAIFAAPWECTITPLDTCSDVVLDGADYQAIRESDDPFAREIIAQYEDWRPKATWLGPEFDPARVSSTLFDCVAVQLAHDESLLEIETLPLVVADDGFTRIDPARGRPVRCAMAWRDLASFKTQLARTFTQGA